MFYLLSYAHFGEVFRISGEKGFAELGFAKVDVDRRERQGFPEVVYGEGKTAEEIIKILEVLIREGGNVIATRVDAEKAATVRRVLSDLRYSERARLLYHQAEEPPVDNAHEILVLAAGTSDIPVAEEARLTAELMGNTVRAVYDVGVAGLHRLLAHEEDIRNANVLIVVAGMEGALVSVVAGLTDKPLIAVPTSVGYGASFGGVAALLSMINSCSTGVAVVNIDNGFGAGAMAGRINKLR
ncbi:nickel pincer cofactor biosynthesis protein LarB [Selenomonas sp. TAMA-11512]|uniref:nickel pincer cofactor biosynthesis protein LarB n=1 Tax=Selenomonas sp. TAMA-11512 TaxID=3095337 RepID=UPI00308CC15C|nr:nickel pincer cofactor biosynthesis protein LarB [Selenomonas sp. TAMA-11512]